jgi:beta-lactamase regulating signal transducer with metallopeptidase domain
MEPLLRLLLTNAALAGVLAATAWVASRFVRRPAVAHALWLAAIVKLLTPPLVPVPLLPSPAFDPGRAFAAAAHAPADTPVDEGRRIRSPRPLASIADATAGWGTIEPRNASAAAVAVIFLGTGGVLVLSAWRHARFRRLLVCATAAPQPLAARAAELAGLVGLRRSPPVRLLPAAVPPMLWPTLRGPKLLLPADLVDRLGDDERDALLVHELAHLRRRDHWVRVVELCATALFWWYPLAWWMRRRLRRAEERCCDEWVLRTLPGSARAYASGLLKSLTLVSGEATPLPAGASGAGPVRDLAERLEEILMSRTLPPIATPLRLALAAVALAAVTVFPVRAATKATEVQPTTPAKARPAAPRTPAAAPSPQTAPAPAIAEPPGSPVAAPAPAEPASPEVEATTDVDAVPPEEAVAPLPFVVQPAPPPAGVPTPAGPLALPAPPALVIAPAAALAGAPPPPAPASSTPPPFAMTPPPSMAPAPFVAPALPGLPVAPPGRASIAPPAATALPPGVGRGRRVIGGVPGGVVAGVPGGVVGGVPGGIVAGVPGAAIAAAPSGTSVDALRERTAQLTRSLADQLAALRDALSRAGADQAELESEVRRLQTALDALQGGAAATPRAAPAGRRSPSPTP